MTAPEKPILPPIGEKVFAPARSYPRQSLSHFQGLGRTPSQKWQTSGRSAQLAPAVKQAFPLPARFARVI
jgi:hypothetical protein